MAVLDKIVKSYAQALLSLVEEKSVEAVCATGDDMERILSYTRFTALSEFLSSPYVTRDDKFDVIEWVFGPKLVEGVHKFYAPEGGGEAPLQPPGTPLANIIATEDRVRREGQSPLKREFVVSPVRKTTFCFLSLLVDRGIIGFLEKIACTYLDLFRKLCKIDIVYISVPYLIPPGGGLFQLPEVNRKVQDLFKVLSRFNWQGKSKAVRTFRYKFRLDFGLIAGCTVQVNSTYFDCSVSGELGRLAKSLDFQNVSLDDYYV
jgi:F0F1-type ATP synthase delta subunit